MASAALASLRRAGTRVLDALHRHPLAWAALLSALLLAGLLLTVDTRFQTNDDVSMQSVVDGSITGDPQPHLVFTNILIGLLLQGLYRATGAFPWYGAYLYLLHYAALVALAYLVFSGRRERLGLRLLLLAAVVTVCNVPTWMELQFTSAALLLGGTGVALFLAVVDRTPLPRVAVGAAAAMVGVSFWVRWQSGLAVAAVAVPLLAPFLRRANLRRFAVFAAGGALVVGLGSAVEAGYYHGRPEWREYAAFNSTRGPLHLSPALMDLDPEVLAEVGWSTNDLRIFDRWFFTDPEVFAAEDLSVIADALPRVFSPAQAWDLLGNQAQGWPARFRVGLIAGLGALAWAEGGRRQRVAVVTGTLAVGATLFGLGALAKLPVRVSVPLLAALAMSLLAALGTEARSQSGGRGRRLSLACRWAAAAIAVGALAAGVWGAARSSGGAAANAAGRYRVLSGLHAVDPGGTFVAWALEVPRWNDPLTPWSRRGLTGPNLIPLGWLQRSPAFEEMLARNGIDDLYAAIARGDVYLPLENPRPEEAYLVYLREHYGFDGLLIPVARVGRLTVFDSVAAFSLDEAGGAITASSFAGDRSVYPIGGPLAQEAIMTAGDGGGEVRVRGRAEAALVAAFDGDAVIALALPTPDPDGLLRFQFTFPRPPGELRLFALQPGSAQEITIRLP